MSARASEAASEAVEIDGEVCLAISVLVADYGCIRFNGIGEGSQAGCQARYSIVEMISPCGEPTCTMNAVPCAQGVPKYMSGVSVAAGYWSQHCI